SEISSPSVKTFGGSYSAKKGWKARNSFSAIPISPSTVEPTTDIFHVVMLSASLNFKCARPCLSVSIWGCQSSVSGKYSRKRGVAICCVAAVFGIAGSERVPERVTKETPALVCKIFDGSAMINTAFSIEPTSSVTSTFVNFDEKTATLVTTEDL